MTLAILMVLFSTICVREICADELIVERDVIFIMDGSNGVNATGFSQMKDWIKSVINGIRDDDPTGAVHFGIVQYSHYYSGREDQPYLATEVQLGAIQDLTILFDTIDNITLHGFTSYTGKALEKTAMDFVKYGRPNATRTAVLIIHGQSSDADVLKRNADLLRLNGTKLLAVGTDEVPKEELTDIGGTNNGSSENVFVVRDFKYLDTITNAVVNEILSKNDWRKDVATTPDPIKADITTALYTTTAVEVTTSASRGLYNVSLLFFVSLCIVLGYSSH